jgi:hypothetical protein
MEFILGNVFIREMDFEQFGGIVTGHTHHFDHVTYIVRGSVQIESFKLIEGADPELQESWVPHKTVIKKASDGHNFVLIKAELKHTLTQLEPNSLGHCIYAHRTPQGEVTLEWDGWREGCV